MVSISTRWSVYAGAYAFLVSAAVLLPLGIVARTLLQVLTLPSGLATILLPGSAALIGAVVWWVVVERHARHTYLRAGAVGLLTVGCTVLLWAGLVAIVYGAGAVAAAGIVVLFVLAVAAPSAFVAAMPLMYIRTRRLSGQSREDGRTPS